MVPVHFCLAKKNFGKICQKKIGDTSQCEHGRYMRRINEQSLRDSIHKHFCIVVEL